MKTIVLILAVVMCVKRFTIVPGLDLADTFKDLSHLLVGGLFSAWFVHRSNANQWLAMGSKASVPLAAAAWYRNLAIGVTFLEVFCGIVGKKTGMSIVDCFKTLL